MKCAGSPASPPPAVHGLQHFCDSTTKGMVNGREPLHLLLKCFHGQSTIVRATGPPLFDAGLNKRTVLWWFRPYHVQSIFV